MNGDDSHDDCVNVDDRSRKKHNLPTDSKLHKKIIKKCQAISEQEQLPVKAEVIQEHSSNWRDQRFLQSSQEQSKKAKKADRKVKTIAGKIGKRARRIYPNSNIS
ncbi:MAG: hypothetical protein H6572_09015 [Lewinellaceae bacterium]|nr:hypothetical protein [Lewinellaceae bacterium]